MPKPYCQVPDNRLCFWLYQKDVGYPNAKQRAALAEARRVIEESAIATYRDFKFQAPDTGQPQGQSLGSNPAPGAAAAPQIHHTAE